MAITRMNVDGARAAIANYKSKEQEFNTIVMTLKATLFDLQGTWKGVAEQAYEAQARQLFDNLASITNSIEGAVERVEFAIQQYDEVEAQNQSAINAVEEGQADYGF